MLSFFFSVRPPSHVSIYFYADVCNLHVSLWMYRQHSRRQPARRVLQPNIPSSCKHIIKFLLFTSTDKARTARAPYLVGPGISPSRSMYEYTSYHNPPLQPLATPILTSMQPPPNHSKRPTYNEKDNLPLIVYLLVEASRSTGLPARHACACVLEGTLKRGATGKAPRQCSRDG